MNNAIICIYNDPEKYPPTLNAISLLADIYNSVTVIGLGMEGQGKWKYPDNCSVYLLPGPLHGVRLFGKLNSIRSLLRFISFIKARLKADLPQLLLCYDDIALFAGWKAKKKAGWKGEFWYHNHDAHDIQAVSRRSALGISLANQARIFQDLNVFSYPAAERLEYFPLQNFKGKMFLLPNYPEKRFYQGFGPRVHEFHEEAVRLLYQGSICEGHCLEVIIPILKERVDSRPITLTLIGPITQSYRSELIFMANLHGVEKQLNILDPLPYAFLPYVTRSHTIGLAMYEADNINYSTGGTASNKIYEYAACGLPVLALDIPHYREHLGKYSWVVLAARETASIYSEIEHIVSRFGDLSRSGHEDFTERIHFATAFPLKKSCL